MSSTQGALFLARELQEMARPEAPVEVDLEARVDTSAPIYRWPITDLMTDRALVEWARVASEMGLIH